jgi:CRP-like cAMP-binding protein
MSRRDARALRDELAAAIDRGKFKRAVECILELEQLEPRDGSWPKRAAEVYRRIGRNRDAIAAYERAAERYAQAGFLVQAIAVCKQILQIDPQHSETLHRLTRMTEERQTGPTGVRAIGVAARSIPELTVGRNTGPIPRVDPATLVPPDRPVDMLDVPTQPPIPAPAPPSFAEFELPDSDGVPLAEPEPPFDRAEDRLAPLPSLPPLPDLPRLATGPIGPRPPPPPPPRRPTAAPPPIPTAAARSRRASPPPVSGARRRTRSTTKTPVPLEPGAPLDTVPLASVIDGAEPIRTNDGLSSGIIVIPLEDVDDVTGPIDVEEDLELAAEETVVGVDAFESAGDDDAIPTAGSSVSLAAPRALSAAARRAVTSTPLLSGLDPDVLESLVSRLDLMHLEAGQVLFREGDVGDSLFIISEGEVAVISEGPPRKELSRLLPGSFFGEVALITETPRSATIAAVARTELLVIDRDVVRELVTESPDTLRVILRFIRNRLVEKMIQTSPMFTVFEEPDRRALAEKFDFLEIEPASVLVRQGIRPDGLFVILAGKAEVQRDLGAATRSLGFLSPGEVIGEMALWGAEPALATVITRTKVLALRMPAATFREVIMTHPQVLAYVGELAEQRRRLAESPPEDSGDVVDLKLDLI